MPEPYYAGRRVIHTVAPGSVAGSSPGPLVSTDPFYRGRSMVLTVPPGAVPGTAAEVSVAAGDPFFRGRSRIHTVLPAAEEEAFNPSCVFDHMFAFGSPGPGTLNWDTVWIDTDGYQSPDAAFNTDVRIPVGLGGVYYLVAHLPIGRLGIDFPSADWDIGFMKIDPPTFEVYGRRAFGHTGHDELKDSTDSFVTISWIGVLDEGDLLIVEGHSGNYPHAYNGDDVAQWTGIYLGDKPGAIAYMTDTLSRNAAAAQVFEINTLGARIDDPTDGGMFVPEDGMYIVISAYTFTIFGPGWTDANSYDVAVIPFVEGGDNFPARVADSPHDSFPTQTVMGWSDLDDLDVFTNEVTLTTVWMGRLVTGDFVGSVLIFDTASALDDGTFNADPRQTYTAVYKLADVPNDLVGARVVDYEDFANTLGAFSTKDVVSLHSPPNYRTWGTAGVYVEPTMVVTEPGVWLINAASDLTATETYATFAGGPRIGGAVWLDLWKNGDIVASGAYDLRNLFNTGYVIGLYMTWVGMAELGDVFRLTWRNSSSREFYVSNLSHSFLALKFGCAPTDFCDDFNRTESVGSLGNGWVWSSYDSLVDSPEDAIASVNGTEMLVTPTLPANQYESWRNPGIPYLTEGTISFDFWVPADVTDITTYSITQIGDQYFVGNSQGAFSLDQSPNDWVVSGFTHDLDLVYVFTPDASSWYKIKIRFDGVDDLVKVWKRGSSEPGSWTSFGASGVTGTPRATTAVLDIYWTPAAEAARVDNLCVRSP